MNIESCSGIWDGKTKREERSYGKMQLKMRESGCVSRFIILWKKLTQ